jgi:MFS family permease
VTPTSIDAGEGSPDALDARSSAKRGGAFASLRHRDFAVFWTAALLSNIGTWMQTITVPYALDELTHSTGLVGVGVFFSLFPAIVANPLGGSLADRYSRRNVLICSQGAMMVTAFALWGLWETDSATPFNLIACVTVSGLANGFTNGAWFAFVTELVPPKDMLNAVRLNAMQHQGARAVGPAVAGLVLASFGAGTAFFANGLSFVIVLAALLVIPVRLVTSEAADRMWAHFREGLRYFRARRVLAVSVLTFFVFGFFGQAMIQLVEPFTRRILHADATQYGLLAGAYGIGAVVGALVTVHTEHWRRSRLIVVGGSAVVGSELAFGLAPNYGFALGAITLFGVAWVVTQVSIQTTVQANVQESYRGRVLALYSTAASGAIPLGALIGGAVGQLIDLRTVYVTAALLLMGYGAYAMARFSGLRLFDQTLEHTEHIRSESSRSL